MATWHDKNCGSGDIPSAADSKLRSSAVKRGENSFLQVVSNAMQRAGLTQGRPHGRKSALVIGKVSMNSHLLGMSSHQHDPLCRCYQILCRGLG